jgi:hypothetical protein
LAVFYTGSREREFYVLELFFLDLCETKETSKRREKRGVDERRRCKIVVNCAARAYETGAFQRQRNPL